ncbi:hypothetical protein [Treponema sp.]|uniref:tetratricopeptide repeat protein n=1 Tax=Treponema sp. TaxID=166 RepID=UPI00298D64D8|nr:hypothetical protein [Treponema sp.]MCQ2241445.1 hypothetical protein [Treponema sp.]
MKRILNHFIWTVFLAFSFFSCSGKNQLREYEALKAWGIEKNNLHEILVNHDISHPNNFEAKVDLASLYVLSGDYEKAEEYLRRAEKTKSNSLSSEYLCNYFGLRASFCFVFKKYDEALEWCHKATSMSCGDKYGFLEGQIYHAKNDRRNALESLRKAFNRNPENASAGDLKTFSFLLAENEDYDECMSCINRILEEGFYFYGFGQFASTVFENKGMLFESILSAYLDFEYASNFSEVDAEQFLKNLFLIKMKYKDLEISSDVNRAVQCLTAVIKGEESFPDNPDSKFIVYDYLKLKHLILKGNKSEGILEDMLALKTSFNCFPVYHYLVAEAYENSNFVGFPTECYEAILNISSENKYSEYSRNKMGTAIGLDKEDSKKLMVVSEIKKLLKILLKQEDEISKTKLFDLLSLPDNKFVFFAEELIRSNRDNQILKKTIQEKYESSEGRLKERLSYVIYQ